MMKPMDRSPLDVIDAAASLWTDDDYSNPEYERALVELCGRFLGYTSDDTDLIRAAILGRRGQTTY